MHEFALLCTLVPVNCSLHFHNHSCERFPVTWKKSPKHQAHVRVCLSYRRVCVSRNPKRWKWNLLHVPVACCGWRWWDGTDGSQFGSHTLSSPSSAQAHFLHPALSSAAAEEVRHLLPDSELQHTKHTQSQGEGSPAQKENIPETPSDAIHLSTHPPPIVSGPPLLYTG